MHFEKITFFRPDEISREKTRIPAELFNHCRLLLNRSQTDCQFVPIRSLQYQAVITQHEIIFVSAIGYAVQDGEGGRIIRLAWELAMEGTRDSLSEPVAIEVVQYHPDTEELRQRLPLEFARAMDAMLERQLHDQPQPQHLKVVPIKG